MQRSLQWLLFIYQVPPEPSSARSGIWRETKRLGALSIQHGVCLLPRNAANQAAFAQLASRVAEYGGEASILKTSSPDAAWRDRTITRFNAARDEEYAEVVDEAERFREEIARERRREKFTFAELEDEEGNLERLKRFLAQVEKRDSFGAKGRAHAVVELKVCARELARFENDVYARQDSEAIRGVQASASGERRRRQRKVL